MVCSKADEKKPINKTNALRLSIPITHLLYILFLYPGSTSIISRTVFGLKIRFSSNGGSVPGLEHHSLFADSSLIEFLTLIDAMGLTPR